MDAGPTKPTKIAALFCFALFVSMPVCAERHIVVNGRSLTVSEIMFFDQFACRQMEDGEYWLDPATGLWGYRQDQTIRGRMTGDCQTLAHVPEPKHDISGGE